MTENFVILPDDSSNAGKLVRTNQRTVNGSSVEEHFTILQDYSSDNQAKIDSDGKLNIAGSISSMPEVVATNLDIRDLSASSDSIQALLGSTSIYNKVAGSIVNLPGVEINNPEIIGSYSVQGVSGIITANTGLYAGSKFYQGETFGVSGNVNATILGSIIVGSVSANVDSVYIQSGNNINITGMPKTQVYGSGTFATNIGNTGSVHINNQITEVTTGSNSWIKGGSIEVYNKIAGSIVNMPVVTVSATALDIRDLSSSSDSVSALLGSTSIYNTITGSIISMPSVDINSPSSIGSYSIQNILVPGSVEVFSNTGSVEIYGELNTATGSEQWIQNWGNLGSRRVITNFGDLGSSRVITNLYAGSKFYQGDRFGVSGNITIENSSLTTTLGSTSLYDLGSNAWVEVTTGSIHVTNFSAGTGYAGSDVWQGTNPWIVEGSVAVTSPINVETGSESWIQNIVEISGSKLDNLAGSFAVSNFNVIGSERSISNFSDIGSSRIITAGSVIVTNDVRQSDMGSPCYKQATAIASGTYTQVWPIGGAGSRLEIHGYHISTNLAGIINLVGSATSPNLINRNYLNFASGAAIEKTFVTPIIPEAADVPIGFQTTSAGSTAVTIYGREVK